MKDCLFCGQEKPNRNRKYCSLSCGNKARVLTEEDRKKISDGNKRAAKEYYDNLLGLIIEKIVVCSVCSKEFTIEEREKKSKDNYYCSKECSDPPQECSYCKKICKNRNSKAQHEIRCKKNSDHISTDNSGIIQYNKKLKEGLVEKKYSNQFTKAKELGLPTPEFSEDTKRKISEKSRKQKWTKQQKENHSAAMKKAVLDNPESYSSSNQGTRVKKVKYKGIILDSSWEVEFAIWCDNNNIKWERNTKGFHYEWEGDRIYYPDFYLPEMNKYVEVKGYEREKDKAKWKVVKDLIIIKRAEIKLIKDNKYKI
jgi:hypothetical protein